MAASRDLTWHQPEVSRTQREFRKGHRGAVLWFTGLSASGKSTLAHAVEDQLFRQGFHTFVLDGDNVRHGLCNDLGFSLEDRDENLRRVGEVAKLFLEAGVVVLSAFISPLRKERERIRSLFLPGDFFEVFCSASLEICEERDPKGLYQRARQGHIKDFTGISSPYEPPLAPDLFLDTDRLTVEESVSQILHLVSKRVKISPSSTQEPGR